MRLPKMFAGDLLRTILRAVDGGTFHERVHKGIGPNRELCLGGGTALGLLGFLTNDENLFRIVRRITCCAAITCFDGRVYRTLPAGGHCDAWHSDTGAHRLVAMSVNLSRDPYRGGVLRIRERSSRRIVRKVHNVGLGDAVLFRIDPRFEHRITDVQGSAAKTAFAGWFQSQPDFRSLVKGILL